VVMLAVMGVALDGSRDAEDNGKKGGGRELHSDIYCKILVIYVSGVWHAKRELLPRRIWGKNVHVSERQEVPNGARICEETDT
jgi:hypothetical protein